MTMSRTGRRGVAIAFNAPQPDEMHGSDTEVRNAAHAAPTLSRLTLVQLFARLARARNHRSMHILRCP
jgi:hypothetical protein